MTEPIACPTCGETTWTDTVSIDETEVITFDTFTNTISRAGHKYNEERNSDWWCSNNHPANDEIAEQLETTYERTEETNG